MGVFTPDVKTLEELYKNKLQMALSSEKQIVQKGLPGMIEKASNPDLKAALQKHLEESRMHVSRLEWILDEVEGEENESKCKVTAALIASAESVLSDTENEGVRDVVLIAAGNEVEHHEIAVYGTLRTWAEVLGYDDQALTLDKTLEEERAADMVLTDLAEEINVEAPVA